jgi:LPPG:FO 2-phospho-L-lactate transferase
MKVVALAGGVGGAKLVDGLAQVLQPDQLTVIVNTGDDFEHLGLYICPDLDTVCYTLAGVSNITTGWGRTEESWNTFSEICRLGGADWFGLGDRDLATHILRTFYRKQGLSLSQITSLFCQTWGVKVSVLPMTNESVSTIVLTKDGCELTFQEYFVHQRCEPEVKGFRFEGSFSAKPAGGVLQAIDLADLVIICPSNPWVSIDPIMNIPEIKEHLSPKKIIAVSPIIGGHTIKGPAAKMYTELGIVPSAIAVANSYKGLISAFVIDNQDASQVTQINAWGIMTLVSNIIMKNRTDRERLASEILDFSFSNFY